MNRPPIAMTRWDLARRDLLKGLGLGAACLPLLAARRARAAITQRRLICVMHTAGYTQAQWRPATGPLAGQTLPPCSSPLEPHKSDLIFLPALTNPSFIKGERWGEDAYGTIFWGGPPTADPVPQPTGKTVDQVVAEALGPARRPSLALGVQLDVPPAQVALGACRCFWTGAGQPVNPELDPYRVYQELFLGTGAQPQGDADPAVKRLATERKSILDYVGRSLERFKWRLGTEDRRAIDSHFDALRQLEKDIAPPVDAPPGAGCPPPAVEMMDLIARTSYPKILSAHMGLMVAALRCGVTHVATLQLSDRSGDQVDFGSIIPGVPARGTGVKSPYRNWHDIAHNPVMGGVNHKVMVDKWVMERLAELISRCKAVPEADGTLLDTTAILWGSHMEQGDTHASQKVPWILAGKAGNYFSTGQCADSAGKPINGVLTAICNAMGIPGEPFGPALAGIKRL